MMKTKSPTRKAPNFQLLDLSYMKQISRNDFAYERAVIKVFIQTIPENLKELNNALQLKSYIDLHRIFHHMKSSLSVMGLDKKLNRFFEEDQLGKIDIQQLKEDIDFINAVCTKAVEEAKEYLKVIG